MNEFFLLKTLIITSPFHTEHNKAPELSRNTSIYATMRFLQHSLFLSFSPLSLSLCLSSLSVFLPSLSPSFVCFSHCLSLVSNSFLLSLCLFSLSVSPFFLYYLSVFLLLSLFFLSPLSLSHCLSITLFHSLSVSLSFSIMKKKIISDNSCTTFVKLWHK